MAGESYYIVFSIIAVLVVILHIVNVAYFRAKKKTVLGENVKQGMPGYEKFQRLSSASGLTLATALALTLIVNLANAVNRVMSLGDPEYARTMLVYAPIVIVLFFVVMLFLMRDKLRSDKHK